MKEMATHKVKDAKSETCSSLDEKIATAAAALAEADVLFLVTGAGFSADSGLPVYADIGRNLPRGMTYADVAQPAMLEKDPGEIVLHSDHVYVPSVTNISHVDSYTLFVFNSLILRILGPCSP